jgi:WD40 repeat protein
MIPPPFSQWFREFAQESAISFDKSALAWTLTWDADWVTSVCFLGPTRRLAAGNNLGQVLVWDLPDKIGAPAPNPARRLDGHTNVVSGLVCTRDGRWLISASYDHTIRYWDMQAPAPGEESLVLNARAIAEAQARKRNVAKIPTPLPATVQTQPSARTLAAHGDWINRLTLSRDEQRLVSGDDAGQVIVWDREAGKELRRWRVKGWTYALALSPDNKQAFVSERVPLVFDSGRHAGAKLWDATTGAMQRDLGTDLKGMYIAGAAYSPDGKLLALARGGEVDGTNGKVYLFDPASGKKIRELVPGHLNGATALAFHPDGKHLASAGRDTTVRIWNTADGKLVKELGKPRGGQFKDWIQGISFSGDGRWLAAADMAGAVQVWSLTG